MLAKIYDALTILLIVCGIVAILLIIIYRDVLFGGGVVNNNNSDTHEYLVESSVIVDSRWLSSVSSLRDARVFLPEGLEAVVFASGLNNPQEIKVISEDNLIVITEENTGNIVVFKDTDQDYSADLSRIFKSSLPNPKGIDYNDNALYVGTAEGVVRFDNFSEQYSNETSNYVRIVDSLPRINSGLNLSVGLGRLFVALPASCNYCIENDIRRGSIVEYSLEGGEEKIYATGLKNVSALDFIQGSLVAAENSIESSVFNVKDEFNIIRKDGFYGWPYYVNANEVFTPFSSTPPAGKTPIIPEIMFDQGSTPSGLVFVENNPFSDNTLFVALANSGSVVSVNYTSLDSSLNDFLIIKLNGEVVSNPVDVASYQNGLLVLDKKNGVLLFIRQKSN